MWVIAKIKNKYQDTLKNEFRKALRGKCSFYNPVFEKSYKQSHSNRIILKKKNLLNSYIFCYSELFEDKINLRKISSTVGLDYFLSISKNISKDINDFIKLCKLHEDERGILKNSFFINFLSKQVKINIGILTDVIAEVISSDKRLIKLEVGNKKLTLQANFNSKYFQIS
jgi:hypothetical protein|tara:strand:+ start:1187 stop:1696 length:510 start_codon:yes stop_codon:yes gene_type:complete